MFSALRVSKLPSLASATRAFSTSRPAAFDVAKLTLVGRLSRDAESLLTKTEKPYVRYTVITSSSYVDQNGERQYVPNFHTVHCFSPQNMEYLSKLKKGTQVFAQANYSIREPATSADPATYQGQRQINLTHDSLRVLNLPRPRTDAEESESVEQTETTL